MEKRKKWKKIQATFTVKKGLAKTSDVEGGRHYGCGNSGTFAAATRASLKMPARWLVMALERVPADIRADGGVARMSDPEMIHKIMETVSYPGDG